MAESGAPLFLKIIRNLTGNLAAVYNVIIIVFDDDRNNC